MVRHRGGNRGKGYEGGGKGYKGYEGYEGGKGKGYRQGRRQGRVWRAKYSTQNHQCHRHRVAYFYPHESLESHTLTATDMWISGEPSRARSLAACWRVRSG